MLEGQADIEVVGQADSLAAARQLLSGVDLALIDRGLPDGDRLEIISELREASPGAAVLVMSTTAEEAHPEEALEAGADGVLDKIETPNKYLPRYGRWEAVRPGYSWVSRPLSREERD
jgi:DNA-binding NarL/FixJ family response regulator